MLLGGRSSVLAGLLISRLPPPVGYLLRYSQRDQPTGQALRGPQRHWHVKRPFALVLSQVLQQVQRSSLGVEDECALLPPRDPIDPVCTQPLEPFQTEVPQVADAQ